MEDFLKDPISYLDAHPITWFAIAIFIVSSVGFLVNIYAKEIVEALFVRFYNNKERVDFSATDVKDFKKNFVANPVSSEDGSEIQSVDDFIRRIILDQKPETKRIYLLMAPTGVGKTTYLVNTYDTYKRWSFLKKKPKLILGKLHCSDTINLVNGLKSKGKTKNTVLLLDAMDEYQPKEIVRTGKQYLSSFTGAWRERIKDLESFRTVIISVREQFLQSAIYNKAEYELETLLIENAPTVLHLRPFQEKQVKDYFELKFIKEPDKVEKLIELVKKFRRSELDFIGTPLILTYAEDILNAIGARPIENLKLKSEKQIYKVIVDAWLNREIDKLGVQNMQGSQTRKEALEALQRIIATIASVVAISPNTTINAKELVGIETLPGDEAKIIFKRGLNDRSLLVKKDKRIQFVHNSFLEYFLAVYFIQNNDPELEKQIPFAKYDFALKILISWRWNKADKSQAPFNQHLLPDNWKYLLPGVVPIYNTISPALLIAWLHFFEGLSVNSEARAALQNDLYGILQYDDPNWQNAFIRIAEKGIVVDDSNIPTTGQAFTVESSYGSVQADEQMLKTAFAYLKHYVKRVELKLSSPEDLWFLNHASRIEALDFIDSGITDELLKYFTNSRHRMKWLFLGGNRIPIEDLQYFDGADKLEVLDLQNNGLEGEVLRYFSRSVHTIKQLWLAGNRIPIEDLQHFNGAGKLEELDLQNNGLEGEVLRYFSRSIHTIKKLWLAGNRIPIEDLQYFDGADKLEVLGLQNNGLEGEVLRYFSRSVHTIKKLWLAGNRIPIEDLQHFDGTDKLEVLSLENNGLEGEVLRYFSRSVHTIKKLWLAGNRITIEDLQYFDGADKLEVLDLQNNGLEGEVLRYFSRSVHTIKQLWLAGNRIPIEDLQHFNGADKLEELDLQNNGLEGEVLRYFSRSVHTIKKLWLGGNRIPIEDLQHFDGADKLEELGLENNGLEGEVLRYFSRSVHTIKKLWLGGNRIPIEDLQHFDGADKLEELGLENNGLEGEMLKYFSRSVHMIKKLGLGGNRIPIEDLQHFDGADKLEELNLQNNGLEGEVLRYFSRSVHTIKKLWLGGNRIPIEDLQHFDGADKLEELGLENNGLEGEMLKYFSRSVHMIKKLGLGGNRIPIEDLQHFNGADKLEVLDLQNNGLEGEVLKYFSRSAHTVKQLWLAGNRIPIEDLKCFFKEAIHLEELWLRDMNLTNEIILSIATYSKLLKKISIAMNRDITDILPLDILQKLTYIKIAGCSISDEEVIDRFRKRGVEVVTEDV